MGEDKKYKISIDKDVCIGCGSCSAIAPNTFKIGSDTKAEVKKADGDDEKTILQAAKSCPVEAIKIKDSSGKQIFPKK